MLDTLRYSKRLQSAGVSREQAEAQAEALAQELRESISTREQVEGVETRLESKIAEVKTQLQAEIGEVRTELRYIRWMGGLLIGLVAAVLVKVMML